MRGAENVLHRAPVEYPRRAVEKRVEGEVVVDVTLDEEGHVQDARVASGPDELRAAALQSVLRWHFSEPRSGAAQVAIRFRLPAKGEPGAPGEKARRFEQRVPVEKKGPRPGLKADNERQIEELEQALKDQGLAAEQREKYEHLLAERQAEQQALVGDMAKVAQKFEMEKALLEKRQRLELERTQRQIEELEQALKDQALAAQQREQYAHTLAERQVKLNALTADMAELVQRQEREMQARQEQVVELQRAEHELRRLDEPGTITVDEWRLKRKLEEQRPLKTREPLEGTLAAIHVARLPEAAQRQLLSQLGVNVGDAIDASAAERIHDAVRRFDEHLKVSFGRNREGGIVLSIAAP